MKKETHSTIKVEKNIKEQLQTCLYSQGKSLNGALLEEINYIIDNNIPIENPVKNFLNIREKLIEKYGTVKTAAEKANVNYQGLINSINLIERKKENCQLKKSTISMLSNLLEK